MAKTIKEQILELEAQRSKNLTPQQVKELNDKIRELYKLVK